MALGPVGHAPSAVHGSEPISGDALTACVVAAAERLVVDLERAVVATHDWTDRELGAALVDTAMSRCLTELASTGCWGREHQLVAGHLWRIAGAWLEPGWLQTRARQKPRGYAGDHELLARIWDRRSSDDPLGGLWDRYFQAQAAADVVRARFEQIGFTLVERALASTRQPYRVLSVGSGPAIEIEVAARRLPSARRDALEVSLYDLDDEALTHAQLRLADCLRANQVVTQRENLFRLPSGKKSLSLPTADFCLCMGLFDYLDVEHAVALLRTLWQVTAPGGVLIVGNFAPHCPSRAYMEWIGQWYLLYRTPDELLALAEQAGLPSPCVRLAAERYGVDLFLVAEKPPE